MRQIVYAVKYSNYEPPEIAALYSKEEEAKKHATYLNEQDNDELEWEVMTMFVRSAFETGDR